MLRKIMLSLALLALVGHADAYQVKLPERQQGIIVIDTAAPIGSFDHPLIMHWPKDIPIPIEIRFEDGSAWSHITAIDLVHAYSKIVDLQTKPTIIFVIFMDR